MTTSSASNFLSLGASLLPFMNSNLEVPMISKRRSPTAIVTLLAAAALLAFLSLGWNAKAFSAEPADTLLLVARPAVSDPLYGQSILVAHQMPGGSHVGFILNKPTQMKLAEAFPGHEASLAVTDPLYLGGPASLNAVFALVQGAVRPAEGTMALTGDLYLAISNAAVDQAIAASTQERARFFVGAVVWREGELEAEVRQGAWYVLEATAERVLPGQTAGHWEQLVRQADMVANGI